jgi:hypothetical protein
VELKDYRDWTAFVVGVVAPAIVGVVLLSSELSKSPSTVQGAFAAVLVLAVFFAFIAFMMWRSQRGLKDRLGLVDIKLRDQAPPLHTTYRGIQRAYRWHGVSAVNELVGQTEVQAAIAKRSTEGAEFLFVLADPRDWIRVKEQKRWENEETRSIEKMIENISGSENVVRSLKAGGARVSLLSAARLPPFRIVEVDGERIEVAHYDRGGCGYSGVYLVLRKPKKGDGLLYEWFRRAADLERKNAVLDQLYDQIFTLLTNGRKPEDVVQTLTTDVRYEDLRRRFDSYFDWKLDADDVAKSVEYIIARLKDRRA